MYVCLLQVSDDFLIDPALVGLNTLLVFVPISARIQIFYTLVPYQCLLLTSGPSILR